MGQPEKAEEVLKTAAENVEKDELKKINEKIEEITKVKNQNTNDQGVTTPALTQDKNESTPIADLSFEPTPVMKEEQAPGLTSIFPEERINKMRNAKQGDILLFGVYEQDNNCLNGKEPIEWIVLSNNNAELYVLSKYVLDGKPYNEEYVDVTWETSTLRRWLNEEFYLSAFSLAEQGMIQLVDLKNEDNPEYGTEGGNDTKDRIFLPSIADMVNPKYGFLDIYYDVDENKMMNRRCSPTEYAKAKGIWTKASYQTNDGFTACFSWCLRSPGSRTTFVADVFASGEVSCSGGGVGYFIDEEDNLDIDFNPACGIRPAMILRLQ